MIGWKCLVFLFLLLLNGEVIAQVVSASEHPDSDPYSGLRQQALSPKDFNHFLQSFSWSKSAERKVEWECLGPDHMPEQLHPGGRGIPSYAVNRGNGTGRVNALYLDPHHKGRLFACSPTGGLFLTVDEGENWQNCGTDQLPISGVASVATDPRNPYRWWIVTGDGDGDFAFSDGVWRTDDAGKTWVNINGTGSRRFPVSYLNWEYTRASKILVHPTDPELIFVASNKGLFRSISSSASPNSIKWIQVASGEFYDIEVLPWDDQSLVASGTSLFISHNKGRKWKKQPQPSIPNSDHTFIRINCELSPLDSTFLHCGIASRKSWDEKIIGEGSYQRFNLNTLEWEFVRSLKQGMNNFIPSRGRAFAVSPRDPNFLLCGNVQPLYRSVDGGREFQPITRGQMHDDIHHVVFSEEEGKIWAAHDGGVSLSEDDGQTWESRNTGLGVANVMGLSTAQSLENRVLFGGYDTGGNLLLNGKWWHTNFGDGFETVIHADDPSRMIATAQNGSLYRSSDTLLFGKPASHGTKAEWHTFLRSDPFESNTLYIAGNRLMRSKDFGDSWESILDVKAFNPDWSTVFTFYLSPAHEGVLYAYILPSSGYVPIVLRTFNAQDPASEVNWEKVASPPVEAWVTGLSIDLSNPKSFYLATGGVMPGKKLWKYDGQNYSDISGNLDWAILDDLIADPLTGNMYIASSHGVWLMRPEEEGKYTRLSGLPGVFVRGLAINAVAGKLLAGTFGRGVWQMELIR